MLLFYGGRKTLLAVPFRSRECRARSPERPHGKARNGRLGRATSCRTAIVVATAGWCYEYFRVWEALPFDDLFASILTSSAVLRPTPSRAFRTAEALLVVNGTMATRHNQGRDTLPDPPCAVLQDRILLDRKTKWANERPLGGL